MFYPRALRSDQDRLDTARDRREQLAGEGLCINGRSHGKATHGKKCEHCYYVHKGHLPRPSADPKCTTPVAPPIRRVA